MYDSLAAVDAAAIIRFLERRGYIRKTEESNRGIDLGLSLESTLPPPAVIREATPLSGVDMVEVRMTSTVYHYFSLWHCCFFMYFCVTVLDFSVPFLTFT